MRRQATATQRQPRHCTSVVFRAVGPRTEKEYEILGACSALRDRGASGGSGAIRSISHPLRTHCACLHSFMIQSCWQSDCPTCRCHVCMSALRLVSSAAAAGSILTRAAVSWGRGQVEFRGRQDSGSGSQVILSSPVQFRQRALCSGSARTACTACTAVRGQLAACSETLMGIMQTACPLRPARRRRRPYSVPSAGFAQGSVLPSWDLGDSAPGAAPGV